MTALAASRSSGFPHAAGSWARPACSTRPGSATSWPSELARPGRLGAHADPRLARRHDGAGAVAPARWTASRWPTCCPPTRSSELVTRTRNGGAEIVALLKTGSAYYAPSAAAARMARAVAEDSGAVMPVCAWVDGEYGISGVYLGVEAEIGADGRAPGRRARPDRRRAGRACARPPRPSAPSRPTSPASNSAPPGRARFRGNAPGGPARRPVPSRTRACRTPGRPGRPPGSAAARSWPRCRPRPRR